MLWLKSRIENNFTIRGWGGLGIVSNWYLYECLVENGEICGFVKNEVMSRVVELNKQGCLIACKWISSALEKE